MIGYADTSFLVSLYARARNLASLHGSKLGTRALDVLHVALALELKADAFLTFDQRQAALWKASTGQDALP